VIRRLCVRTMRGTDDADIGSEDRYTRWQMNEDMQVRRNQKTIELLKDTDYASKRHGNFIPYRVSLLKRNGIGLAVMEPTDSGWNIRVIHHPVRFDSPYFFREKWVFVGVLFIYSTLSPVSNACK